MCSGCSLTLGKSLSLLVLHHLQPSSKMRLMSVEGEESEITQI